MKMRLQEAGFGSLSCCTCVPLAAQVCEEEEEEEDQCQRQQRAGQQLAIGYEAVGLISADTVHV